MAELELSPDFADLLREFAAADVRFLVVGAYAVAHHGHPRTTGDLDVWIDATTENAKRARAALRRFGAPLRGLTLADLRDPEVVFQMGVPPNRIDVLSGISGVAFEDAWPRRDEIALAGARVGIIGFEDLVRNKRAAGREKDLLDVKVLERLARARTRGRRR